LELLPELRGQNVILVILGSTVPSTRSRFKINLSERPLSFPEQAFSASPRTPGKIKNAKLRDAIVNIGSREKHATLILKTGRIVAGSLLNPQQNVNTFRRYIAFLDKRLQFGFLLNIYVPFWTIHLYSLSWRS
jgi:hypothetical protein